MNPRNEMNNLLNRMWAIFTHVVRVPDHSNHIQDYVEAQDEAKGLLSKLCTKSLSECVDCDGCRE